MTTERAALTDTAPAGVEADPDLNPSDRPETDQPGAKAAADPTAAVAMRRNRNPSAETQRLYAADWRAFEDWCREQSLVPLAADATTVAAFLTQGAKTLSAGTLSRRATAIAERHRQSGFASPAADPAVTAILRAARRTATPRRPAPKPSATLIRMAVRCPRDLAGTRDRAVLLLAANGLSRAALVGLDVEHIRFTTTAVELSLGAIAGRGARRTAGEGRGVPVVIRSSADRAVCPVQALRDWLDTSETQFGPVFRKIDRWGTLEHHRLGTDAIRRILARRALRRTAKSHKARGANGRMSRRPAVTATQAAATKAEAAADALLAWLQTQPTRTASHREATDPATERGEPLAGRPAPPCARTWSNPIHSSRQRPSQSSPILLVRPPPHRLTTQSGVSGAQRCGWTTPTGSITDC